MAASPVTTANLTQVVPFLGVTDMERSLSFYLDGLGFTLKNKWEPEGRIRWCWLTRGGASLMLQEYVKEGHGGRRPEGVLGQGVNLCFQCEDAVALYHEFRSRSLEPTEPFVGNNMWVTSLRDPDGYRVEFESATDAPEETKLSEFEASKKT
jgi:catechol 2,3-dioxygenase-like lactoylglutathione lyase family enzyme